MRHNTVQYLLDPQHPITINLIGCGGTGSSVLTNLARINFALQNLGHPGFVVFAFDPDRISMANVGRQLFSPAEIGMNKATALISRINRFFGSGWKAEDVLYSETSFRPANITISCVDTAAARIEISKILTDYQDQLLLNSKNNEYFNSAPYTTSYYWMDFGNSRDTGQVILGTTETIKTKSFDPPDYLPNVIEKFPDIEKYDTEKIQGPSCSLADALNKQDLFINSTLAALGCDLLWKLFREGGIEYHGLFLNLKNMKVNPITIGQETTK